MAQDKQVELKELKKALSDCVRDAGEIQKEVNALETQLEQLRARRHTLFKQCKLEDIALPLLRGTLDVAVDEAASASTSGAGMSSIEVDTLNTDVSFFISALVMLSFHLYCLSAPSPFS